MYFKQFIPHPLLKGYVEKIWIFESAGKAPDEDIKLIVPNDRIKLAIPYRNGIIATVSDKSHLTQEHTFTLTGMMDKSFKMDIATDSASGTICAEFNPDTAYYFFRLNLSEVRNKVVSMSDIISTEARYWEQRIADTELIEQKVSVFQKFLLTQLLKHKHDKIFEFCVNKIKLSEGTIIIKELERQTGYSRRWLNAKFAENIGISPKNLASLIRFKNYYEILCDNSKYENNRNLYYNHYYDQSHFIKDFKRYTSFTPRNIEKVMNQWGRLFYNV